MHKKQKRTVQLFHIAQNNAAENPLELSAVFIIILCF